jgi:hypothetical protein
MEVLKYARKISLAKTFAAAALCSLISIYVAEPLAVQDLDDYAQDNNIPTEVFDGLPYKDQTKVYRKNLAGFFYDVGVSSWRMSKALGHKAFNEDDETLIRGAVTGAVLPLVYSYSLVLRTASNVTMAVLGYDINAYALPAYTADGECVINPPNEMTVREFIHQFTDIPKEHLSSFSDDISPIMPIMVHEAEHCGLILSQTLKERSLNSFTLGGEASADNQYMKQHQRLYPDSSLDRVFLYTRAVSLLSRKSFDAGHATSLNVDAYIRGAKPPTREEAYYNYGHLNELVKKELLDFKALGDDEDGEYYQAVYGVVQVLLNGDELTPLMRRAAELYVEGVEYIADNSPLFKAPEIQPKAQSISLPAPPSA